MRGNAIKRNPGRNTLLLQRFGVKDIALPALVESRHRFARVHNDVRAGGILQAAMRAKSGAFGQAAFIHQPAP